MKTKLKNFIKKYFSSFVFFYRYLGNRIFLAFFLSVAVSFLDGLGLTMFFPLLQVVGGEGEVDTEAMGNMRYLLEGIEQTGISLTLISVLVIMLVFFSLKGIATYMSNVYIIILQQRFIRSIRLDLLEHFNRLSFKTFITSDVGRIQNTMTGEVDRVSRAFATYFRTFQHGVMVAVYMAFAFFIDPQFAVLVTIGGILTNFLYKIIYKHTKGASRKLTKYNSEFQGQVIQHIGHFKYLKATGMVSKYASQLRKTIYKIESSRRKIGVLASISTAIREPLLVVIIALVIYIQVQFYGGAIGPIIISLLFFYRALTSLVAMQGQWNVFMEVSGSMENMLSFQKELKGGKENDGSIAIDQLNHSIILENVSFNYGATPILTDINLKIHKNESLAFVGESGSGKTTLVSLIAGLLPPERGIHLVDGIQISDIKKDSYKSRIGYVSQDPVIFNDSIYNNVTFWAEETSDNLQRFNHCLRQAAIYEFVLQLPAGKETELGNNGINLSGGQKQRISIARELYKDIDLLILDEATSALDSDTEMNIQESIEELQGQYTLLIVAHRLSTIRKADRIVFMDEGRIIDIDTFEALIAKQERFKRMVKLQEV